MARRRYGRRRGRRGGFKLPIISIAILAAQAAAANAAPGGTVLNKLDEFQSFYTGYDVTSRTFHPERLAIGYVPWLAKRFLLPIARPRLGGLHLPVSLS